jgi:hypothetical protein
VQLSLKRASGSAVDTGGGSDSGTTTQLKRYVLTRWLLCSQSQSQSPIALSSVRDIFMDATDSSVLWIVEDWPALIRRIDFKTGIGLCALCTVPHIYLQPLISL